MPDFNEMNFFEWFQTIAAVVGALAVIFVVLQLRLTHKTIREQMVVDANSLLMTVQLAAIQCEQLPGTINSSATGYTPLERLHLLQLLYLHRVSEMRKDGFLPNDSWKAECNYCDWVVKQAGFHTMWTGGLQNQYDTLFSDWIKNPLKPPRKLAKPPLLKRLFR